MTINEKILKLLFTLQGLFWLGFSVLYFFVRHDYIVPLLMMIGVLAFFVFAWNVKRKDKRIWLASFVYMIVNIILTITDQFGWVDLIVLLLSLVTLVFIIITTKKK